MISTMQYTGKNIFVAGGAGLLGQALVREGLSRCAEMHASYFRREPARVIESCYHHYDFRDYQNCLSAVEGMDYVIICAIQAGGIKAIQQSPTFYLKDNLAIHANLFEACAQMGVKKVICVSSSTVYPESKAPSKESDLDLNIPPSETYLGVGWLHRYIDELAKCYFKKRSLPIGIVRTSSIYGPYDHFDVEKSHVIPALILKAIRKEKPFLVWGDSATTRDFIYVDDLAEGIFKILEMHCIADPVNISSGVGTTIGELVQLVLEECAHDVVPKYDLSQPTAIPYRVLDGGKARAILGYSTNTSLRDGLRQTIEWVKSDAFRE